MLGKETRDFRNVSESHGGDYLHHWKISETKQNETPWNTWYMPQDDSLTADDPWGKLLGCCESIASDFSSISSSADVCMKLCHQKSALTTKSTRRLLACSPTMTPTQHPTQQDVLFGRGNGVHPGNIHFRALIAERAERYRDADLTRESRYAIVQEIIDNIHELGGKFLQSTDRNGAKQWHRASGVTTFIMVKNALSGKAGSSRRGQFSATEIRRANRSQPSELGPVAPEPATVASAVSSSLQNPAPDSSSSCDDLPTECPQHAAHGSLPMTSGHDRRRILVCEIAGRQKIIQEAKAILEKQQREQLAALDALFSIDCENDVMFSSHAPKMHHSRA